MNILYVTNMYPHEGHPYYGIFVKEQIEAINALNGSEGREISSKVIFINSKKTLLVYLWSIVSINFHLIFNRYDVIHIHYGLSGLFLLFNPFIRIPVVITFHGGDIQKERDRSVQRFISSKLAKKAAICIVLNDKMEDAVKKTGGKTLLAPCGIDTNIFNNTPQNENKNEGYTVVFPGSSEIAVKNYPLFKEVINEAERILKSEINIIEIKNMTRSDVAQALNDADCLLMTSFSEGSPQIIKEAMACNLPVVSTNVGDVSDQISGVDNCYIAKENRTESLLEPLLTVLHSGRRSENSRNMVFDKGLDSGSVAVKIFESYRSLLK